MSEVKALKRYTLCYLQNRMRQKIAQFWKQ